MKTLSLLIIASLADSSGLAQLASGAETAAKAAVQYVESLKETDMTDAIYLSAQFPNLTDEEMRRLTSKVATALKSQPITILLETSKVLEDCAVVVGKQSAEDLDPVFLLKQGGQWRVLPTVTRNDHSSFSLSDVQRGRFQKLEGWFEEKMAENYRRLAGQVRNADTSKQVTDGYADLQERERRSESGRYELPQKPELIMRSRFAKPNTLAALALAITTPLTLTLSPLRGEGTAIRILTQSRDTWSSRQPNWELLSSTEI